MLEDGGNKRSQYRPWLLGAVGATVLGIVAFALMVSGLLHSPNSDVTASGTSATPRAALVVAVARTAGGPARWIDYTRVVKLLSQKLHRELTIRYIPEESQAAEVLAKEPADIAFVCPRTYLKLSEGGSYTGIAVPVIDATATTVFQLVVAGGSQARSFEDLKGKRIAVSDKTSLGGWAYVQWLAQRHGVDVNDYFSELGFGETMSRNLIDLRAGRVDVTVINRVQSDPGAAAGLRVIEQSGPVPNPPVVVRSSLSPALVAEVRDALVGLKPGELGSDARLDGFAPLRSEDFTLAAEIAAACKDESHMR